MGWYGNCSKWRGNKESWKDFPKILWIPLLMVFIPTICLMMCVVIALIGSLLQLGIPGILMLCFLVGTTIIGCLDSMS